MSDTARHRHTSLARHVSLPAVTISAALVAAAVVVGDVTLLRASAIIALAVVVVVAVLFDHELLNDRRAHGLERANLARAYAVEYAGWIEGQRATTWSMAPGNQSGAELGSHGTPSSPQSSGVPVVMAAADDTAEAWNELADAPTVVNLVAWEERLRESRSPAPQAGDSHTSAPDVADRRKLA